MKTSSISMDQDNIVLPYQQEDEFIGLVLIQIANKGLTTNHIKGMAATGIKLLDALLKSIHFTILKWFLLMLDLIILFSFLMKTLHIALVKMKVNFCNMIHQ